MGGSIHRCLGLGVFLHPTYSYVDLQMDSQGQGAQCRSISRLRSLPIFMHPFLSCIPLRLIVVPAYSIPLQTPCHSRMLSVCYPTNVPLLVYTCTSHLPLPRNRSPCPRTCTRHRLVIQPQPMSLPSVHRTLSSTTLLSPTTTSGFDSLYPAHTCAQRSWLQCPSCPALTVDTQ
ncbi:hypothetical protein C8Q76DRAFT_146278 [Earliella scabrosa]|nr:hypothetical protein C8Q76DRAFT_146278 [Earliella scabrosa]